MSVDKPNASSLDTVKKQINYNELAKGELLEIIAYLQSELEARDVLIAILKNEKSRALYQQARYGHLPGRGGDPFQALQRDSEVVERQGTGHNNNSSVSCGLGLPHNSSSPSLDKTGQVNVDALRPMYDSQLSQLENLIATQKRSQQKLRDQLATTEKNYRKALLDLEEARKSHERDTAQGDDVLVHLEKERERLSTELEHERSQRHKLEKEVQRLRQVWEETHLMNDLQTRVATKLIAQFLATQPPEVTTATPSTVHNPTEPIMALRNGGHEGSASPTSVPSKGVEESRNGVVSRPGVLDTGVSPTGIVSPVAIPVSTSSQVELRSPTLGVALESAADRRSGSPSPHFVSKMSLPPQNEGSAASSTTPPLSPAGAQESLFLPPPSSYQDASPSASAQILRNHNNNPANNRLKPEPPIRRTPEQSYTAKALVPPTTTSSSTSHRILPQQPQAAPTTRSTEPTGTAAQVVYATPRKVLPQQPLGTSPTGAGVVGVIRPMQFSGSPTTAILSGISNNTVNMASASNPGVNYVASSPGSARILVKMPLSTSLPSNNEALHGDMSTGHNNGPHYPTHVTGPNSPSVRKFPSHYHPVGMNTVVRGMTPGPTAPHMVAGTAPAGSVFLYHPHNHGGQGVSTSPSSSTPSSSVLPATSATQQHR